MRDSESGTVSSGRCGELGQVRLPMDVDQVMSDLIHHQQATLEATFLQ